jgi:predicted extracellular nuclease
LETYASISGLQDLDAAVGIKPVERYTYLFDMNAQQLDHMFVSESVVSGKGGRKKARYEHVHINTWVDAAAMVSDHDPSVASLDVCS